MKSWKKEIIFVCCICMVFSACRGKSSKQEVVTAVNTQLFHSEQDYLEAIKQNGTDELIYLGLANLYLKDGREEDFLNIVEIGLEKAPSTQELQNIRLRWQKQKELKELESQLSEKELDAQAIQKSREDEIGKLKHQIEESAQKLREEEQTQKAKVRELEAQYQESVRMLENIEKEHQQYLNELKDKTEVSKKKMEQEEVAYQEEMTRLKQELETHRWEYQEAVGEQRKQQDVLAVRLAEQKEKLLSASGEEKITLEKEVRQNELLLQEMNVLTDLLLNTEPGNMEESYEVLEAIRTSRQQQNEALEKAAEQAVKELVYAKNLAVKGKQEAEKKYAEAVSENKKILEEQKLQIEKLNEMIALNMVRKEESEKKTAELEKEIEAVQVEIDSVAKEKKGVLAALEKQYEADNEKMVSQKAEKEKDISILQIQLEKLQQQYSETEKEQEEALTKLQKELAQKETESLENIQKLEQELAQVEAEIKEAQNYIVKWADPAMEALIRTWLNRPEGDIKANDLESIESITILGNSHVYINGADQSGEKEAWYWTEEKQQDGEKVFGGYHLETKPEEAVQTAEEDTAKSESNSEEPGAEAPAESAAEETPVANDFEQPVAEESAGELSEDISEISTLSDLQHFRSLKNFQIVSSKVKSGIDKLPETMEALSIIDGWLVDNAEIEKCTLEKLVLAYNAEPELPKGTLTLEMLLEVTGKTEEELASVTELDLSSRELKDISVLSGMTGLKSLNLSMNQISDLSALAGMDSLETLNLAENQLTDLSALSEMTKLKNLDCSKNQITDISVLKKFTKLQKLYLSDNQIQDLDAISARGKQDLMELVLDNNQISDVEPLSGHRSFDLISMAGNPVEDWSPVSHIKGLKK